MGLIDQLQNYAEFTVSEKSVIDAIFKKPDLLKNATAQELAELAYTSSSTVARLCQKLKCKNYHEFRIKLIAEMQERQVNNTFIDASFPFHSTDTLEDIIKQLTRLQSMTLNETVSLINMKHLEHAIQMLAQADSIDIYGATLNLHLAYDFAYKMALIHRTVQITPDHQQQLIFAATPRKKHCAIVISYSGETTYVIEYARLLHKMKTPMISITSEGPNSISKYANEHLYIASLEKQFSKIGTFASCASITIILNFLYAGIFSLDYDNNYERLHSIALRATNFRSQASPLKEDV